MYMERIEAGTRTKAPARSKALKLAAGAVFLPFAALIWVPWLCVTAAWFVLAGLGRAFAKAGATLRDSLLHAGELVVGR
jgi:hypothetical protein